MAAVRITSPDDPALAELAARLAEMAIELDHRPQWPAEQLRLCGEYGVYGWFLDAAWGGQAWNDEQVVRGYMALAAACLTTTFIITQRTGACRRIAGCNNEDLKRRVLPGLASGSVVAGPASVVAGPASVVAGPASVVAGLPTVPLGAGSGDPRTTGAGSGDPRTTWPFATVGISHLTTSRRHLARPVLTAERIPGGFRLDGMSPWVTGGAAADVLVLAATEIEGGATTDRQLLIAVPTSSPGLAVAEPLRLIGVSASATGPVHLEGVEVKDEWLIAGPMPNVMASGVGAGTGGIETSTLAVGLAHAAIEYLAGESRGRSELQQPAAALRAEHRVLRDDLLAVARGNPSCTKESLRQRANSLASRASQAALSAAKGSGYVVGHPAGRWCREALFFLVWSCPQPVAAANLCELAGIEN